MRETTDSGTSARRRERFVLALIAVGALLRIAQYLANRSLWLDEAYLVPTILDRPLRDLFRPPEFRQVVPVGFLLLERAATALFGRSEYALRSVPLLAGLISLPLFRSAASRFLPERGLPFAVALFAFSDPLIYYSSELKQYSTDVAIGLLLLLLAERARHEPAPRRIALLAVAGALAIWFSHPAVFVLAAAGVVLLRAAVRRGDRTGTAAVAAAGILWCASFAAFYFATLRAPGSSPEVLRFWSADFFPIPPRSLSNLYWLPQRLGAMFADPIGMTFRGLGILAFLTGIVVLWRADRDRLGLLLGPLAFTLAASALRRYPFAGRLLLFLVPSFLILIALGVETIREALWPKARAAAWILIALMLFHPVGISLKFLVWPRTREEVRSAIADARAGRRPGDRLFVYPATEPVFRYYASRSVFRSEDLVPATWHPDWSGYGPDFAALRGRGRIWILLSHTRRRDHSDDEPLLARLLDAAAVRLEVHRHPGASAYLYDFGSRPR